MTQETRKSTSKVEVVPVSFFKHPNADNLSVAQVFGGYSYVGRTEDWVGVQKAAYIPPDNIVDATRPEFTFLFEEKKLQTVDGNTSCPIRIKAKKLRGVISFGLMVPVPDDTPIGDDWADKLGVLHYEPPTEEEKKADKLHLGGELDKAPEVNTGPYYDIDAARRYAKQVFIPGEPVIVTEKLDGSNCRVVWHNDRLWVKSRNDWKKRQADYSHLTVEGLVEKGVPAEKAAEIIAKKSGPQPVNGFWQIVERTPGLVKLCQDNPGTTVFGEVYGNINCIKYGLPDTNRFAAFDIYQNGKFLDFQEAFQLALNYGVPWAPIVSTEPGYGIKAFDFDFDKLCEMAEGETLIADAKPKTIREGIVVAPLVERWDHKIGRVKLKFVSGQYLERFR